MEFVVFWILCGVLGAVIASSKGASGAIGFLLGLLFGPIGVIITFFMGSEAAQVDKKVSNGTMKKCPRCAEAVLPDAHVCKHCGHEFEGVMM
ncbi:MAG: zinc ribbon domain-containing protein [Sphingomonadaceae bacterium]|nr:zinc ribbon domain-containing protein [Sphingomonadaceae bacterium]